MHKRLPPAYRRNLDPTHDVAQVAPTLIAHDVNQSAV